MIASGIVKKVLIADFLLSPFVDSVFGNPGVASAPVHLLAVYSFAFQIYCDFSGYTDMARGLGCLLGFELPLNFREPYLSRDPSEFWRRWHITLSQWFRDYLYIPLGGNRIGPARTYWNLLVTMLLGGLWHGAGWGFVIWGAAHGLFLALHRRFSGTGKDPERPFGASDVLRVALTFHAVCLLWVFFRANSLDDAMLVLGKIFAGSYGVAWPVLPALVVVLCAVLHGVERVLRLRLPEIRRWLGMGPLGGLVEGVALGVIAALALAAGGLGSDFIYFQF